MSCSRTPSSRRRLARPRRLAGLLALAWPALPALAGLSLDEAGRLALDQAPALQAQQHNVAGAQALQPAAGALPPPKVAAGVENLPISGPDRFSLTRDGMTMKRFGLMQDVPNAAKRAARASGAAAKLAREQAMLTATRLTVKREATLAWLGVHYAEQRAAVLAELTPQNRLLLDTVDARIAANRAMPADRTMARQDALMLADRRDDAQRDVARARATLRRWVGMRADEPLEGSAPAIAIDPQAVREGLHRHAELLPYVAMQAMAQADLAEAQAETRGDWAWEVAYNRRGPGFGDMLGFQISFELPWARPQPSLAAASARQQEALRIEAERDDQMRRHAEESEAQLAELQALDAQHARLQAQGLPLTQERVTLALAAYESGRGDLAAVIAARRDVIEARLRLVELDAQRQALRVRLSTLIAE